MKVVENGGYNMSRSYKKPFVKMAKDVEFQKNGEPRVPS